MREIRQLPALGLLALISLAVLAACGETAGLRAGEPTVTSASTPTPSGSYFDGAISIELTAPVAVRQGESAPVDVVMTNHGDEPFRFASSVEPGLIVIGNSGETVLWRPAGDLGSAFVEWRADLPFTLAPGESAALNELWRSRSFGRIGGGASSWDLRDEDGLSVAPGGYLLQGAVSVLVEGTTEPVLLETAPRSLVVQPSPLAELAAGLHVEMTAPGQVAAWESVPMEMRLTNMNNVPIAIQFRELFVLGVRAGQRMSLDIIISGPEGPVWQGMRAHRVTGSGTVTLEPGESRTMGSLFGGYGVPWEWDQRDASGARVQPGTYTVRGLATVVDPETGEGVTIGAGPQELVIMPQSEPPATPTPVPSLSTATSHLGGAVTLELSGPTEVRQGQWLDGLDVIMTNTGGAPFSFSYSGDLLDFEARDAEGNLVWRSLLMSVDPLGGFTLRPGESKALSEMEWAGRGRWDLRNEEGFPVPPGEYEVQGVVRMSLGDPREAHRLETAPLPLTVHEAPPPDYAEALEIELIVPPESPLGEPLPLDMRLTNTGGEQMVLWYGGTNYSWVTNAYHSSPRVSYLDVVVFSDGEVVYRAVPSHEVSGLGTLTLGPSETRTLSMLFDDASLPWHWDQVAVTGEPVAPGTYTIRGVATVSRSSEPTDRPPFNSPEQAVTVATEPRELVIGP